VTVSPTPPSTLFPYTTLFRSDLAAPLCRRAIWIGPNRHFAPPSSLGSASRTTSILCALTGSSARCSLTARASMRRQHCLRKPPRSEEHTSELQSLAYLVCRLL